MVLLHRQNGEAAPFLLKKTHRKINAKNPQPIDKLTAILYN